jgi:hypothetical protein
MFLVSYSYCTWKNAESAIQRFPHEPPFLTQWLHCKETELVSCKQRFFSFDQMSTLTWILIFHTFVELLQNSHCPKWISLLILLNYLIKVFHDFSVTWEQAYTLSVSYYSFLPCVWQGNILLNICEGLNKYLASITTSNIFFQTLCCKLILLTVR